MTNKYHGPRCPAYPIHHGLMRLEPDRLKPELGTEWVCPDCHRRLYLDQDGRRVSAANTPRLKDHQKPKRRK